MEIALKNDASLAPISKTPSKPDVKFEDGGGKPPKWRKILADVAKHPLFNTFVSAILGVLAGVIIIGGGHKFKVIEEGVMDATIKTQFELPGALIGEYQAYTGGLAQFKIGDKMFSLAEKNAQIINGENSICKIELRNIDPNKRNPQNGNVTFRYVCAR